MAKSTKTAAVSYQNNPFYIGLSGLKSLFNNALPIGLLFVGISVVSLFSRSPGEDRRAGQSDEEIVAAVQQDIANTFSGLTASDWVMIAILGVLLLLIGFMLNGITDYTSAKLAQGKTVKLGDAIGEVFSQLPSYIWLNIIIAVKVILWSLLFIIPGIYKAVRYSLSGTSFFAEGLKGNAAIQRSLALTKDAWLTTFASHLLWNVITLGLIAAVLQPGTNSVLYRQYAALTDAKQAKPAPHVLSWVAFVLPIMVVVLLAALVLLLIAAFVNYSQAA